MDCDQPIPRSERFNERYRHYSLLASGETQYDLEVTEQNFADFSLEVRHPFYDRRLVEFCLALPSEQKLYKGYNRAVARRALACLPSEVRWRGDKASNAAVFHRGLMTFDKALVKDVLLRDHSHIDKYVDIEQARRAYHMLEKGNTSGGAGVWSIVILELWLRKEEKFTGAVSAPSDY